MNRIPAVAQSVDQQFEVDALEIARVNHYVRFYEEKAKESWVDANRNGFTNSTGFCSEDT